MRANASFWGGFTLGVGVMYLLDPDRGGRRRALVRDKAVRAFHDSQEFLGKAGRDLKHRIGGRLAQEQSPSGEAVNDVLTERVRAKLGHHCSHAHAVDLRVMNGRVTLRGPILAAETRDVISAVSDIPGVTEVVNEMEEHGTADNIPALQGEPWRPSRIQRNWTPGIQLLTGVLGATVITLGVMRAVGRRHAAEEDTWDFHESPDYAPSA